MTVTIWQRRICWPSFDATCLEGGCGYCNTNRFRDVAAIERAVKRGLGTPVNRGDGSDADLEKAFKWGVRHHFANAETRYVERRRDHEQGQTQEVQPESAVARPKTPQTGG